MSGTDGFEVARRLKADAATAHIPIVFMTGLTETEHLVAALEASIGLGYFRGIMNLLDEIDAAQPECAAWTAMQRGYARQFQFDAMSRALLPEDA